jgi:glutaredoxin
MPELILYSRPDCHLCDVAAQLLGSLGLAWQVADIDEDERLVRRYGIRIPVLQRADTGDELFWPFDEDKIRKLIGGAGQMPPTGPV